MEQYITVIPFPKTPSGFRRMEAWVELASKVAETRIKMVCTKIRQKNQVYRFKEDPCYDGPTYTKAIKVGFATEQDYLLFQLQFSDDLLARAIIQSISRHRKYIARKAHKAELKRQAEERWEQQRKVEGYWSRVKSNKYEWV